MASNANGEGEYNTKCSMAFRNTHHIGRKTLKLYATLARTYAEKRQYTKHLRVQRRT